jgi:anti-anti-sigma factor
MELQYTELDNNIRLIKLIGTLNIIGTSKIETQFAEHCAGDGARVIVDLSEVDFLSSMGIRLLMLTAKSVDSRGGKMVLLRPIPEVRGILDIAGILGVIPVYGHVESAAIGLMDF